MSRLLYSMSVTADGFIEDPDGDFSWGAPDAEIFRFHTDRVGELGGFVCGRRLYETMVYWEDPEKEAEFGADEREFAEIWRRLPKVVFSSTLKSVKGNARLATAGVAEEIRRLQDEVEGDIEIGGATLAAAAIDQDLVDEYKIFICPVILGGGKPFFPPRAESLELELMETRSFASRVVYVCYRRPRPG